MIIRVKGIAEGLGSPSLTHEFDMIANGEGYGYYMNDSGVFWYLAPSQYELAPKRIKEEKIEVSNDDFISIPINKVSFKLEYES